MSFTLNTPVLYAVNAFDASYSHTFEFTYEGAQIMSSRAIITDSSTQETVYDVRQDGLRLNHVLPANKLVNGTSYSIRLQVYDADGNTSNLSDGILFHCYTTPMFYFANLPENTTLSSANCILRLNYEQGESEKLQEYRYYVYDNTKTQIYLSPAYYTEANKSHPIYGLKNNTYYFVRALGTTVHGMSLDTGYVRLNIAYNTIPANTVFEVKNDAVSGCLIMRSNIISVGYSLDNDYYELSDGELRLYDNVLTYECGTSSDFALIVRGRKLPLGKFLWTNEEGLSLSVVCIDEQYYCRLAVKDRNGTYYRNVNIAHAHLADNNQNPITDSHDNYIIIAEPGSYESETMITFLVYKKKNIYDLRAIYGERR